MKLLYLLFIAMNAQAGDAKIATVLIEENGAQAIVDVYPGGDSALKGRHVLCDSRIQKWCAPREEDLGAIKVGPSGLSIDPTKVKAREAAEAEAAQMAKDKESMAALKEKILAKTATSDELRDFMALFLKGVK
jgi:hypothetical protein